MATMLNRVKKIVDPDQKDTQTHQMEDRIVILDATRLRARKIDIHRAARDGQEDLVHFHIHFEWDPETERFEDRKSSASELCNSLNKDDDTPLELSARYGHLKIMEMLLENGANVDEQGASEMTALHMAAKFVQPDAVKLLIKHGADVNARDAYGYTPLHWIACVTHSEDSSDDQRRQDIQNVFLYLLDEEIIEVDSKDDDEITPLMLACTYGKFELAAELILRGASWLEMDEDGNTALHCCTDTDSSWRIAKLILIHIKGPGDATKQDIEFLRTNIKLHHRLQKMHDLADHGHSSASIEDMTKLKYTNTQSMTDEDVIKTVWEHDPLENVGSKEALTLLKKLDLSDYKKFYNSPEARRNVAVEELKKRIRLCIIYAKDSDGNTALHCAVENGSRRLTKVFLALGKRGPGNYLGYDINAPGQEGKTLLHLLCRKGDHILFQHIMKSNPNVEATDMLSQTPLHLACQYKDSFRIMRSLVRKHDANILAKDADNFTPLMFAAWKGLTRTVAFLLTRPGLDIDAEDQKGRTALHYACESNSVQVVQLLISVLPSTYAFTGRKPDFEKAIDNLDDEELIRSCAASWFTDLDHANALRQRPIEELRKLLKDGGLDIGCGLGSAGHLPNVFKYDSTTGKFVYRQVERGCAYNDKNESSVTLSQEFDLFQPDSAVFVAEWNFTPTVKDGLTFLGYIEVRQSKHGDIHKYEINKMNRSKNRIYFPGTGSYDPAGRTGDPHASERIGGDCYSFQMGLTTAMIKAASLGATEDDLKKLQDLTEDAVKRYHGRMVLHEYMFHQVLCVCIKRETPLSYPAFVLKKTRDKTIDLDHAQHRHTQLFLKSYQAAIKDEKIICQPPKQFFLAAKQKGDVLTKKIDKGDFKDTTPLALAAQEGHIECAALLLGRGADIDSTNDSDMTPLHLACSAGNLGVAKIILKFAFHDTEDILGIGDGVEEDDRDAENVIEAEDDMSRTPLHLAAMNGHTRVVKLLLDSSAVIDARDIDQWTPAHHAAANGHFDTLELLLDHDSDHSVQSKKGHTVLHLAAKNDDIRIVTMLVEEYGADPTILTRRIGGGGGLNVLDMAVDNNASSVARFFIGSKRWFHSLMNNRNQEDKNSGLGRMIKYMPSTAVEALNMCILDNDEPPDSPTYEIKYDFTLLDDDVAPNNNNDDKTVLELMVDFQREGVMKHPVTMALLTYKWRKFGRYIVYAFFLRYLTFLTAITFYVLYVPVLPNAERRLFPIRDREESEHIRHAVDTSFWVIIVNSFLGLALEFGQIYIYKIKYFLDVSNYVEVGLFLLCLYVMDGRLHMKDGKQDDEWRWIALAYTVLLSWIQLVSLARRLPGIGMYILMFQYVVLTFLKVAMLFLMFTLAFALAFFVLLQNSNANFRSFSDALLKTLVMLIGEFEYEGIFDINSQYNALLPQATCAENISCGSVPELAYPNSTKLLFALFVIIMPLLLLNLLVGLAVGDIDAVKGKAELMRLSMEWNLVNDIERKLPFTRVRKLLGIYASGEIVRPSLDRNFLSRLLEAIFGRQSTTESMTVQAKTIEENIDLKLDNMRQEVRSLLDVVNHLDNAAKEQINIAERIDRFFEE